MLTDLRFARFWLVCGWLSVAAALVVCLLPPRMVAVANVNDKVEHTAGFVLLTLWFCGIYPRSKYWRIVLCYLLFGVLIELLQGAMHVGRNADIHDVYADTTGVVLGVVLALTPLGRWPKWIEALFFRQ